VSCFIIALLLPRAPLLDHQAADRPSSSSFPPTQPRIFQVDGDHRVAVVAARDLAAGDELFYNYNYDAAAAPRWATDAGGRRGGGRRGRGRGRGRGGKG
jgi:hypothetical protein